jgi:type I restriction enzyme S subunit
LKIKQKPELQFKAFNDDWKDYKADSIFYSVTDKNHPELPVLSASQERGMVFRKEIGIDIQYDKNSTKTYKRVNPGQFVIHLRSFQGGFAFSNIEGITSPAYTVLDFKSKDINDSLFWKTLLTSKNFIKRLETVTYGIRDGRSISFSDFSTLKFKVPSYNEQVKISGFFKKLDDLITLHHQELVTLKQTKQGFLQKMFPKEGESVPEIRFPGFTGDWDQRKFQDDILSIQTGTNLLGSESNGGTPLIKMGNIQRGYFSLDKLEYLDDSETVSESDIINNGDFIFNTRNSLELVGKGATWFCESGKYAFNSNIARFTFKNINTYFFNYLYNTEQVIQQVRARAVGTTSVAAVYPRDLNSMKYMVPSIEEQFKIGNFFKRIDDTITLQRRELDALKETKKAFLQKMFV